MDTSTKPSSTALAVARINAALMERARRILAMLDPDAPGYVVNARDYVIDDGGGYEGIDFDPRPDLVKADDAAIRRKER